MRGTFHVFRKTLFILKGLEKRVFGKEHVWKIACLENSVFGKEDVWKRACLEKSVFGKEDVWKRECLEKNTIVIVMPLQM